MAKDYQVVSAIINEKGICSICTHWFSEKDLAVVTVNNNQHYFCKSDYRSIPKPHMPFLESTKQWSKLKEDN